MPNNTAEHTALVKDALDALAINGYTAWPTPTGANKATYGDREVWIKYGKTGGGDITGILSPNGRHAEYEAKTGKAVQRKSQKLHQEFVVERRGGLYIVFRSVKDLLDQLLVAGY